MKLYFLRHGIAQDDDGAISDHLRALTPEGIEAMNKVAKGLRAMKVQPTHLFTSPLVRARQTADIAAEALYLTVVEKSELGSGFSISAAERLLSGLKQGDSVMFVGHEPTFSMTIRAIIGGGEVEMKKGGVAHIRVTTVAPLRGVLEWLLPPRVWTGEE